MLGVNAPGFGIDGIKQGGVVARFGVRQANLRCIAGTRGSEGNQILDVVLVCGVNIRPPGCRLQVKYTYRYVVTLLDNKRQ